MADGEYGTIDCPRCHRYTVTVSMDIAAAVRVGGTVRSEFVDELQCEHCDETCLWVKRLARATTAPENVRAAIEGARELAIARSTDRVVGVRRRRRRYERASAWYRALAGVNS